MKTIFVILGILFSTFFLVSGIASVDATGSPSSFDTFVSTSGGMYYAKDSQNNILVSSNIPDNVIKTALNSKGEVNIATGSYILSSTFSGFDLIASTHVKLAKDAYIVVPSGYGGHVFRFNFGSSHNVLEGGIIQEASPIKRSWTGILMQGDSNGIYFNLIENIVMNNPNIAIDFNAASGQWINGNTFVNIQVNNFVRGIEFDLAGASTSGRMDGNTFRDLSFHSGPMTTYGVDNIPNYDNAFYNIQFLNLPPNAISATVDSSAVNTIIIGGTMTQQGFEDKGQNTIVADGVHLPGDIGVPTITIPSENSLLDTQTPTISGINTSGPFSIINVYNNNTTPGTLIGTATSDAYGFWSVTPSQSLPDGTYRISAKIGTARTSSSLLHFTIDTGSVGTIVSETYDNFGNGIYTTKDSQNNILISSSTPDNVIKTALARGGDIYIGTGAYFLSNTFSGFDLVSNTHLKISKTAYIVVPSGFSGHVFRFSSGVVLGTLEGGIIEEASPIKRSWTGILMQGGTSGINLNRVENIVLYDSYIVIDFNAATGQAGINSNTFFNIQGYTFVRGIEFDYAGSPASGFNTNTFLDSPFQSGPMTTYGVKSIKNNDNSFNNVQFWDLPPTSTSSSTVDSTAKNTVIIGGLLTHVGFVDNGVGTTVVDRSRITSGAVITGIISGTVYYDLNVNKIQDLNELGTPGVTITLYSDVTGTKIGTTTTDSTGHYIFTNVPSGNFTLLETIPTGHVNIQPGGATPGVYHYNLLPGISLTRNFGNHAPTVYMQDTAVTTGYGTYSARQVNAQYVGSSSALVGKNIDTMVLTLKKTGTPGGTASIGVFNSDLSVKKLFATLWVSDVSTSYGNYTFSLPSGQTYQIQSGDRIGIKYTGGDPWDLDTAAVDGNNGYDGANSYYTYYTNSWGTSTSSDLAMTLELVNNTADTTSPVITIRGSNPITVQHGSIYVDAGATATDNVDGNITSHIVTSNPVNTAILGTYTVTYNVSDQAGNAATQVTRTVNVVDTTSPVITIRGSNPITVQHGSIYVDAGATATDNVDGNITSHIVTSNPVNTAILGTYTVTYNVSDQAGNAATQVTRTVNVVDTTSPVITIRGSNPITVQHGSIYVDAGATATDNVDGNITSHIVTSNPVNTAILGTYTVTYNVSDQAGNAATQVTRTVNVVDTTLPMLAILSPANNTSTSTPTLQVSGTASDNISVRSVTWRIDNGATSKASGTTSWSFTTPSLSIGIHRIWINATDSNGNIASKDIGIKIVSTGIVTCTVTGTVYNDLNSNGGKDNGESGTSGVPITLYSYTTGQTVGTTTTDSNGLYSFTNVPAGGIAVFETIPSGNTNLQPGGSIPGAYYSAVSAGQTVTFDFGNHGISTPTAVTGTVYNDLNSNGGKDNGESGTSGVPITLYSYTTGQTVGTTTTDSNGLYSFTNVPAGGIAVFETIPSGNTNLQPGGSIPGAYYSAVSAGQTVTFDFGNHGISTPTAVTGTVYNDLNSNGGKDNGESGTSGVPITLYSYTTGQTVGTTTTDSNGLYSFTNVPAGGIAVFETIPSGNTNLQPGGSIPGAYYSAVSAGQTVTFDFGNHGISTPTAVTGTVYNDLNSNGGKDNGESGTSGVPITLYSYTTGQTVGTTTTDSNGLYSFTNVPAGGIAVFETIPSGNTNLQPGGSIPGAYYSAVSAGQTVTFDFGNH